MHTRSSNRQEISASHAVLGGASLLEIEEKLLPLIGGVAHTKAQTFFRLELNGQVFYSSMFTRAKKRNSFTITYQEGGCKECGKIKVCES